MPSMKVGLAQINTSVGAFRENSLRMLAYVEKAALSGVDLLIFPELALSSYPPLDLLDRRDFLDAHTMALQEFLESTQKIQKCPVIILGAILKNSSQEGRPIHNAAITVQNGKIVHTQVKQLLPTYNVFDESRYFEPGRGGPLWQSPWGPTGISVCEDIWYDDLHQGRRIYTCRDPALALQGAQLVLNASSSPYEMGKQDVRTKTLAGFVSRVGAPLIYVNQVGGNDEILCDGDSRIVAINGRTVLRLPSWEEGLGICEIDLPSGQIQKPQFFSPSTPVLQKIGQWIDHSSSLILSDSYSSDDGSEIALLRKGLVMGIRDYFHKTGQKEAIIGLSGGIDSAVVAAIAVEALGPHKVWGYSLPSQFSSSHSLDDAHALAVALQSHYGVASIKFINSAVLMELKRHFAGAAADLTEENLQARLRGVMLMAIANKKNALVLTTGNKSEIAVGYSTIYGDMCGALAPLGDLYKTKVYALAREINREKQVIPQSTLDKPPSAELRPNQKDQDSLPPYDLLDDLLESYFEKGEGRSELVAKGFEESLVDRVLGLIRRSEFKRRQSAPVLKVTNKAFGLGRRIPVAKSF